MTVYSLQLPEQLRGNVRLPASKSLSARALVIAALAGSPQPEGLSDCDDTRVLRSALALQPAVIDILAAGTAMRFSTAFFAVGEGTHVITGTARMKQRPIGVLVDALRRLGAKIDYMETEGCPPLRVSGTPLRGGHLAIPANVSSQYVSALLMIAPMMENGLTLRLEGEIVSTPYINMTISLMRIYGARAEWTDERTVHVEAGGYRPDVHYTIEPDWSAASYWYEIVALCPDPAVRIVLQGLQANSLQGDAVVCDLFRPLGVATTFCNEGVVLTKANPAGQLADNFTACPDLAQTVVATCAMQCRPFSFKGVQSLRIKETNRLAALQTELAKLGCGTAYDDSTISSAYSSIAEAQPAPTIATYDDHRMAMAFAPCAYKFPHLAIANPEVVSKSYPRFWDDLRAIGAKIEVV